MQKKPNALPRMASCYATDGELKVGDDNCRERKESDACRLQQSLC